MKFSVLLFGVLFAISWLGAQSISKDKTYPDFPLGPTGVEASIEPGLKVTIQSVDRQAPAGKSKLRAGDILVSINGHPVSVADPRLVIGREIGSAEAKGGNVVLEFERGGSLMSTSFQLPVLGSYRNNWPAKGCAKSEAIITANARHISKALGNDGSYQLGETRLWATDLKACMAGLFLLSTGDDSHLEKIAGQARTLAGLAENRRNAGGHVNWQLGYHGIFLGEYYLRTGDKMVLKGLKEICDWAAEGQAAGGWGHGANPGPGYVQSGLLNHTTVPIVAALILARECGVEVDEEAYVRAVRFMYRMAGHGCVPYGDHRSELWWSNTNGRNAMLACAFSLLNEPRFQKASEHLATLVADSYHQPEFGHTGGGFNMMWRGIASVHVPKEREVNRKREMNELAWYYDLARLPDGGFSMLSTPPNNTRYFGRGWGAALGLTYTAPNKSLRITGSPRTRFSVDRPPVDFSWGTEQDLVFLSTDHAESFGGEAEDPHVVYDQLMGEGKEKVSVGFCARYLRHFSPLVRTWAARRLKEMNNDASIQALTEAVSDSDPRVRRAVFDALSGYDNWGRPFRTTVKPEVVSEQFLPAILETLNDKDAAWWEKDGALFALGCARPSDIRENLPLVLSYADHDEWYLREAAFWAIVGLKDTMTGEEFNHLSEIYKASRHVFARSSYDAGFRTILKSSKARLGDESMKQAVRALGSTTHQPGVMEGYGDGGIHEAAHRAMMVLKHFDPGVYQHMIEDFVKYLDLWEPYYQHSVWMMTGSKWQPGIPKVMESLGPDGKPIVLALKRVKARYSSFDPRRNGKAAREVEKGIEEAIAQWEKEHGTAK